MCRTRRCSVATRISPSRFGNQPTHVVEAAEHRRVDAVEHEHKQPDAAQRAVTFARDRNLEREAVVEERAILRDALAAIARRRARRGHQAGGRPTR